jgi:hypothetical protein
MFLMVGRLFEVGEGGKGKENGGRVNNIEIHYICAGRGYNHMY